MTAIPNSYHELIEYASGRADISKPHTCNFLKNAGLHQVAYYANAPVLYIVDYSQQKYLYIDTSCGKVLGHYPELPADERHRYLKGLWYPNDMKVFNENIFPEATNFLKRYSVSDYPVFSFSFNYRVKTKDGESFTLLQRATYFSDSADGNPLAAMGTIVNITNYKTDSSIIHTVEKINNDYCALSEVPLFKSVYYPDKTNNVLSKRELEILAAIYEGMCSKQIADKFFVSINTVNNHRKNMLHKTNTNNSSELLHYALHHGLL